MDTKTVISHTIKRFDEIMGMSTQVPETLSTCVKFISIPRHPLSASIYIYTSRNSKRKCIKPYTYTPRVELRRVTRDVPTYNGQTRSLSALFRRCQ